MPFSFKKEEKPGEPILIKLSENVTFLNKAGIMQALNAVPENSKVWVDGKNSEYIHPDVVEIIEDFSIHARTVNIELTVDLPEKYDKDNKGTIKSFKRKVRAADHKEDSYFKTVFNS